MNQLFEINNIIYKNGSSSYLLVSVIIPIISVLIGALLTFFISKQLKKHEIDLLKKEKEEEQKRERLWLLAHFTTELDLNIRFMKDFLNKIDHNITLFEQNGRELFSYLKYSQYLTHFFDESYKKGIIDGEITIYEMQILIFLKTTMIVEQERNVNELFGLYFSGDDLYRQITRDSISTLLHTTKNSFIEKIPILEKILDRLMKKYDWKLKPMNEVNQEGKN